MPRGGLRTTTLQACVLNVMSTVLAQLLKFWKTGVRAKAPSTFNPIGLDVLPVLQFLLFCIVATPPNYLWQQFLEAEFPGKKLPVSAEKVKGRHEKGRLGSIEALDFDANKLQALGRGDDGATKLDLGNTAKKFLLDQTLGALVNNFCFVFGITLIRGGSLQMAIKAIDSDLWPIMSAAYKFWPLYSIVQFTLVPPERRIVMGSIAGLFWNIFLVLRVT